MDMRDQQLFVDSVQTRVQQLIRSHVWEGINDARRVEWFRQFENQDCSLLAACLLDNLMYRSKRQVLSLFKAAFTCHRILPDTADSDMHFVDLLRAHAEPGVRLVPVISLKLPPTKSGPYMLRLLARELQFQDRWMIWPERLANLKDSVHTVIVIDDFCGSGKQFRERFLANPAYQDFRRKRPSCKVIYVAAAAHVDGIKSIHDTASDVSVVAGEVLSGDHNFFSGTVLDQYNDPTLKDELFRQHNRITDKLGLGGRHGPLGFKSQALTYGFDHGTPNNSLPLLWNQVNGWTPLLDR